MRASKIVVKKLSVNFEEATKVETFEVPKPSIDQVLVRVIYVAINASDVNFTAGRYDALIQPPFDAGFEALGEVVAGNSELKTGTPVLAMKYGCFSEYLCLKPQNLIPVPSLDPIYFGCAVSGLTAMISADTCGVDLKDKTVLITAAAGGLGQILVQYSKILGAKTVVGTCSSEEKSVALRELGCDRVINYKKENLKNVLKQEFPKGIDVIFESVGGDIFNSCLQALSIRGTLVVLGSIVNYTTESSKVAFPETVNTGYLLSKSAKVYGFFLSQFWNEIPSAVKNLIHLIQSQKLKVLVDVIPSTGIQAIYEGISHLHSGKNLGKVVVKLSSGSNNASL